MEKFVENTVKNIIKPGAYNIRLISDYELAAISEVRFSEKDLVSKSHCLDSAVFGAVDTKCSVCMKTRCDGHMGLITLPIPIPRAVCIGHIKQLLRVICPVCAHVVLPEETKKKIMEFPPYMRLRTIRDEIDKILARNPIMICPHCGKRITLIEISGSEPLVKFMLTKDVQINPLAIATLLNLFTEIDLVGYNEDWHPKNFFTIYIPIVPNKLRLKLFDSTTSVLGSYYKSIIEEIVPELSKVIKAFPTNNYLKIPVGDLGTKFNHYYDQLNAYYYLITDPTTESVKEASLQLINKRDRKHIDPANSLLGRLKGKGKKLFSKGIIDSRHDCSARTVLGGAPDASVISCMVPEFIANKLSKTYPVYAENLKTMKAIVAAMGNPGNYNNVEIPHVVKIMHNRMNTIRKIESKNAVSEAALLAPGDKVEMSLIDGDFVMQSRYPSVREESWSSLQIKRDKNSIITIPLAICEMKMADFDGDEAQIFVSSSNNYAIEQLLLHSLYKQCIAYKDGFPAIFYTKDSAEGVPRIKNGKTSLIQNWKAVYPAVNAFTAIEEILPKDLNYSSDKLIIKNGKIGEKSNFNDKEFYKYIGSFYGTKYICDVIDKVSQTAYDLNKNDGITLGFTIRVTDSALRSEIIKAKSDLMEELIRNEKSNDPDKEVKQIIAIQKIQVPLKTKLKEDISKTELSSYANRLEELYTMVVSAGQVMTDSGGRLSNILAEGSRTTCAYPRYSVDPRAYGYIDAGYMEDPGAVEQLYNAVAERKALYDKGVSVGTQGYMQKRFCMFFGSAMVGFAGEITDGRRLIALQYGANGTDPRLHCKLSLPKIDLSDKKYSHDTELKFVAGKIAEWKNRYAIHTHEIASNIISDNWTSGVDWNMFIKMNCKPGITPDEIIDKLIMEIKNIFLPQGISKAKPLVYEEYGNGSSINSIFSDPDISLINLYYHIYYFRSIFRQYELTDGIYRKIIENFRRMLCNGGEPAGAKAAVAISEPLTQAVLHAIHGHAGGVSLNRIVRTNGSARFEELIGGASFKNNIVTIGLYDDSKENTENYAKSLETFYLSDILVNSSINITNGIDSIIRDEFPDMDYDNLSFSEYYIQMTWNITSIAAYNIHPVDVINSLMKNYPEIMFIGGYILNSSEVKMHIYFKPDITINEIFSLSEEFGNKIRSTVIHGEYLINCFVSENMSNPGHFLIEANEVSDGIMALENLIYDPEIDPGLCRSTNIETMVNLFGLCEAVAQTQAELTYAASHLSATSGVLQKHYNLVSHILFANGKFSGASRYSIRNDEYSDPLKKINFEDVKKELADATITNRPEPCGDGYVSAYFFGELPPYGDGASKVILYEN